MWSRQPQSFCKYGSLWLCTIPIVNTNNKMRNQAVFYHIFVSICVLNICQTHHTEHHLLPSLILSLIGLGQNKYTVFDRYLSGTHETVMNGCTVMCVLHKSQKKNCFKFNIHIANWITKHTELHTYPHTHTCTHKYIDTQRQTLTHTYAPGHTNIHTHEHTHTRAR